MALLDQGLTNRRSTDSAPAARVELPACQEHEIFQGGSDAAGRVRDSRPVLPVDTVHTLPLGALDPVGHGRDADSKLTGHRPHGLASADGNHHLSASLGLVVC